MKFNINHNLTLCSKCEHLHLEQIRTIDKQRLLEYISTLDNVQMKKVEQAANVSLGMNYMEEYRDGKQKPAK